MSIDTTFQPKTPTYVVDSTGAVQVKEAPQAGAITFRIVNTTAASATTRVAIGQSASLATPTAPAVGTPSGPFNLLLPANAVLYVEVPQASFFRAAAAGTFEVTGGQGGVGG